MRPSALTVVLLLLLVGCSGGDDEARPTDTKTTTSAETIELGVYWLLYGKVWPVLREVEETEAVAAAALEALLAGPTRQERDELFFSTAIPEGTEVESVEVEDGVARVELNGFEDASFAAFGQVVYTLTRFPTVMTVELNGTTNVRSDFEGETPAILVESPLYFQEVANPVRATGTANTFEATFQYELTDTDGRIVDTGFVTATSGTGTRGTFDFTTKEYEIPFDGVGALFVFELSAKDGSRTNLREIPVRMGT